MTKDELMENTQLVELIGACAHDIAMEFLPLGWMNDLRLKEQYTDAALGILEEFLVEVLSLIHPDHIITIEVGGGVVQDVSGLPDWMEYRICDWDNCPDCGEADPNCETCASFHGRTTRPEV